VSYFPREAMRDWDLEDPAGRDMGAVPRSS
jgi:hypothetical protein